MLFKKRVQISRVNVKLVISIEKNWMKVKHVQHFSIPENKDTESLRTQDPRGPKTLNDPGLSRILNRS